MTSSSLTAPTPSQPTPSQPTRSQRTPSIAFPLVLIALGLAFLLSNIGVFRTISWTEAVRLWPLLLVLGGADLLLRPRSFALALVVEVAIVAGAFIYLIGGAAVAPTSLSYSTDVARAGATDLDLTVNYGAGTLTLAGGGTQLVSVLSTREDVSRSLDQNATRAAVTVSSNTETFFGLDAGRDRRWEVRLPSDVRTNLTLNLGAGDFDLDLSNIKVARATIASGASSMSLKLPVPSGDVPLKLSAGMSSLTITVPPGVAYRIQSTGVLQSISGPTSSANYDTATDRVTIELSSAMSSVTIR